MNHTGGTDDPLDQLARDRASGRIGRRRALRLLLGAGAVAAAGGIVARSRTATVSAQADSGCAGFRRPVLSATDCPDRRIPKLPNYTPKVNGCGPQDEPDYIPDDYGFWDFGPPCNNHDICYGTCGTTQDMCDNRFLEDMQTVCNRSTTYLSDTWISCHAVAQVYWYAVNQKGFGPHQQGQIEGCDCCTDPNPICVKCSCNQKVYTDVQVCLGECHASLGCFTGICGPTPCP